MTTFVIHGYEGEMDVAWIHLKTDLERRGFKCQLLRSPKESSATPNRDRAAYVVDSLKDVTDDVILSLTRRATAH